MTCTGMSASIAGICLTGITTEVHPKSTRLDQLEVLTMCFGVVIF
jgi:hypothetical protein